MTTHEKGERTAEELYSSCLPYSEMTEEEIDKLVEYKAGLMVRDETYLATLKAQAEQMEEIRQIHLAAAAKSQERFIELCRKAGEGYEPQQQAQ